MAAAWPEPVERVSSFLRESGAEARIEEFGEAATAQDAATQIGCELDRIVKSLVLVCDDTPVVVLVPGDRRCDPAKVAQALDAGDARVATASEVQSATGFPPGGVAPFPLPKIDAVLMERTLQRHPLVWAGAGSSRHMLGIAPGELARLARARPLDVVTERAYDLSKSKES